MRGALGLGGCGAWLAENGPWVGPVPVKMILLRQWVWHGASGSGREMKPAYFWYPTILLTAVHHFPD